MTARFIIFLYPEHIGGYELLGNKCQWISVDGMREMRCHSASDVDSYVERILDTYNLEDLSELDAHYILIDAGSTPEVKERAVKAFRKCHVDLVTVDTVLPFLIMSNQDLAPGGAIRAHMGGAFSDSWFKCVVEKDGTVTTRRDTCGSSGVEVEEKDFATFALPNAESFNGKQEWIRLLESEQERAHEKYNLDINILKKSQEKYLLDINNLKEKLAKSINKYNKAIEDFKYEKIKSHEKYLLDIQNLKESQEKYLLYINNLKYELEKYKKIIFYQNIESSKRIHFGKIEGTPIIWRVLCRVGTKFLLLSDTSVCKHAFNSNNHAYTNLWAKCNLRSWLNGDFLKLNFTDDEQKKILYTNHDGVSDKIFLLSEEEARKYLVSDQERTCGVWWWLRSLCYKSYKISGIHGGGSIDLDGCEVHIPQGVRPAFWIDLEL